ncbi:MAG: 16S rRNA (guanine(966)-N(2))-methyltransferase RsmD [Pseudomonadota bacterium]|nr:16S rRNA (guanine(966)-N(2))-methyltransferase RsmD [Pseudomonadota bacterium]
MKQAALPTPGRIRIIGGRLRGSKLEVSNAAGLRPTPDRLRETLFNWLMPWIEGARCLDLFAGTGALGIEALSRGAGEVVFVERDAVLVAALRANLDRLKVVAEVVQGSALSWLQAPARPFDVVFLDPPFADDLWLPSLQALQRSPWLSPAALVYVESSREAPPRLPSPWTLWRESQVGAVTGALYRRMSGPL